jgi:hypothetical protein
MMEYCPEKDQASIIEELHACAQMLITDQYGNYVIQHVIRHGKLDDRNKLIDIVTAQVMTLSKHKYASNVVESVMEVGTYEQRQAIISQFTAKNSDGSSPLQLLMKDQFGNYVIRKSSLWYCLDHLTATSYTNVVQSAASNNYKAPSASASSQRLNLNLSFSRNTTMASRSQSSRNSSSRIHRHRRLCHSTSSPVP